jgi:3-hydroxyacyl-[acyl-carrier-protein] dehydratase
MLLNTFFSIVNITSLDEKTLVEVEINKEHAVFEGHFPGNPIVPGVFLIQMIREVIEELQQTKFRIDKADEIKFMNMVIPGQSSHLTLEIQRRVKSENPYAYSIIVTDGVTVFLKMKVDLAAVLNELK